MNEDGIDVRGLLAVPVRHFRLVLVSVAVVMLAAFLYVFAQTPVYSASTLILVDPAGRDALAGERGAQSSNLNSVRVDGEIEILKSDAVAVRVVQAQALMNDPEFGIEANALLQRENPQVQLKTVIERFQRAIRVVRKGDTYLISAQVTSQNPMRAAELANALAEAYIANQIATKIESIEKLAAILRARLGEARAALAGSEQAFNDFIKANMADLQTMGNPQLATQNAALAAIEAQVKEKNARIQVLEQGRASQNWAAIAQTLQDDAVLRLLRQRQAAEARLASAANEAETTVALRGQLADIDSALASQTDEALSGLQTEVASLATKADAKREEIRQTVLAGDIPPEMLTRIYELQQGASITRAQYNTFLARLREVELQASMQMADARVVSAALPPLQPSSQSARVIMLLAAVLASGIGVGLAFLNEYLVGGFSNGAQIIGALHLPLATRIPMVKGEKPPGRPEAAASVAQVFVSKPLSAYAESIRRLRVALDGALLRHLQPEGKGAVILVASTVPAEGKSNTALALGRAYAELGLKSLLIDCDFRKPQLQALAGVPANGGVQAVLAAENMAEAMKDATQQDPQTGLSLLLGDGPGHMPIDQTLQAARFKNLIETARGSFDRIILDSTPLLPMADGLILAGYADVVALSIKWAQTRQKDVRAILSALIEAKPEGAEILALLSHERQGRFGTYHDYTSYYQG